MQKKAWKKNIFLNEKAKHLEAPMTRHYHEFAWLINLFINTKQEKIFFCIELMQPYNR